MYCSIQQIQLALWPEPDLDGFPKNGRIPDLLKPEPKSDTTLLAILILQILNIKLFMQPLPIFHPHKHAQKLLDQKMIFRMYEFGWDGAYNNIVVDLCA